MDQPQTTQQDSTQPNQPAATDTAQAAAVLSPQKMPFDKKWWQLPKTIYIVIGVVFLLSMGSTAYLFFAPQGIFKPKSSDSSLFSQSLNAVKDLPTPIPTSSQTSSGSSINSPTATPVLTVTPTPTPDATASWLTYKNTTYGYSFKYPPDWKVTNLGSLEPKIPSYLTINPSSVATPSTALNITIGASTRTFEEEIALRASTRKTLTVNTMPGSLTEERDSNSNIKYNLVLKGTNYTYILVGKSTYASIFTPFYSTFKLL